MIKVSILLAVCLCLTNTVRIFLMGGNVSNNQTQIYTGLANSTKKNPQPDACSDDWSSTTCPRIAVITSAAGSQAIGNQAYNVDETGSLSYRNLFRKYGFSPKHISVHIDNYQIHADPSTAQGKINVDIIKKADVIFFNGGDQARHSRSWLDDNGSQNSMMIILSTRANSNDIILAGTSAGSMIMCNPMYGGGSSFGQLYFAESVGLAHKQVKDGGINGTGLLDTRNGTRGLQYEQNGGIMAGFKFAPFLVDTHFNARGRFGKLIPGMLQLKFTLGVGIDESTSFYYDDGVGKVYGKAGVFIADISGCYGNRMKYFALQNVTTHYLTTGDSFVFSTKKVVSSKDLITSPYYNGHTDNYDILNYYGCPDTITYLVDQTGSYNMGSTKTPSGFPSNTPVFKLKFGKVNNKTTGNYNWDTKKYTAANARIDFTYQ